MTVQFRRSIGRMVAAGIPLAIGSYAAYATWAWLRYGRPSPPKNADQQDELLDQFMPFYEIVERHHIRVEAPAAITYAAALEMDLQNSPLVRAIMRGREWIMRAQPAANPRSGSFIEQMKAIGWGVLTEIPGREVVMGAVTKPWMADVTFRPLRPGEFVPFREPDYVKIVWTLRVDAAGPEESFFRTETRAITTDSAARRKFRRYWALVSPGIILIRWVALRSVKKGAEQRAH